MCRELSTKVVVAKCKNEVTNFFFFIFYSQFYLVVDTDIFRYIEITLLIWWKYCDHCLHFLLNSPELQTQVESGWWCCRTPVH